MVLFQILLAAMLAVAVAGPGFPAPAVYPHGYPPAAVYRGFPAVYPGAPGYVNAHPFAGYRPFGPPVYTAPGLLY